MDKSDVKVHESQSDTSSVITMKEYAPSEYPSSEPPPAYMKPRSNALRIAKLAAFTVIVSSIILGGFILGASWIQANTARNLDLTLNQELLDDLHPSYEHLIASELLPEQQNNAVNEKQTKIEGRDESQASIKSKNNEEGLLPPPPPPSPTEKSEEKKILDLDEIANLLVQKNIKGNVNCIVEKRRNEELVDHAPMSLNNLPFGLNITTPPRLQHLTGEQMIVICKGDEDEEKESNSEEENEEEEAKVEQLQSIVFPLPNQLLNQIQQIPQIIPLSSILQQVPMQQLQVQQVQQIPIHQIPIQHIPIQQLPQQQQIPFQQFSQQQQIPVQQLTQQQQIMVPQPPQQQQIMVPQPPQQQQIMVPQPPQQQQIMVPQPPQQQQIMIPQQPQQQQQQSQMVYHQPLVMEQPQFQQQPQRQMVLPQRLLFPQQQMMKVQPNVNFVPEMTPLKEVRINHNRIPLNHVLHHRVPINPMAVNDVPFSRMPITHLPIRAEPMMREEPVPVNHLMPPQPQQYQAENFKQEEPKFNGPIIHEHASRFPYFPPQLNQQRPFPVEVRDPGAMRMPGPVTQEPRERFSMSPPNQFLHNNLPENREPEFIEENPNNGFRPIAVDVRPRGQRNEPLMPEMPKISPIIPLNFERRPPGMGKKIRFPEMIDSEEVRENRMPIITEITKIIPFRLEKEEPEFNEASAPPKNMESPEIKIEKLPLRPFPIPINAILDMIFRGIRPLMNNRGHPLPIPIDIKIERIEDKPLGPTPPFIKKFEVIKKEGSLEPEDIFQNSNVQSILNEKNESENGADKDVVEAKVERVEIFNKDNENAHPIPIPADAQNPQIFKITDEEKPSEVGEGSSFEDQAFLPNGQGRGARVFPIPQPIKEAEIFSVFDAKSDKEGDMEVPMESSLTVVNPEKERPEVPDSRQGRLMGFPMASLNYFPLPEDKIVKSPVQIPKAQLQVPGSRSVKLYPVSDANFKSEELKPAADENRPHFVQPRSV